MNRKERSKIIRDIKYEIASGTHTFTICECGRGGNRSGKCVYCLLDMLENGFSQQKKIPSKEVLLKELIGKKYALSQQNEQEKKDE